VTFHAQSIDFPELTLHKAAFRSCEALVSIELPMNISRISSGAFAECASLVTITIGMATIIRKHAFRNCAALRTVVHFAPIAQMDPEAFPTPTPSLQFKHAE
jgi:hypothetical protein